MRPRRRIEPSVCWRPTCGYSRKRPWALPASKGGMVTGSDLAPRVRLAKRLTWRTSARVRSIMSRVR